MDTPTPYDMLTVVGLDGAAALFDGVGERLLPIRFDSIERALDFVEKLKQDPRLLTQTALMAAWRAYRRDLIYGRKQAVAEENAAA